jgi:uncharacterized phage protein gp47/JayE
MAVQSLQSITNSMALNITGAFPKADVSNGSILSDIVIIPPAQEIAKLYDQDQRTSDNQALATASEDGLAIIGSNLNKSRIPAIAANGIITLFSYTPPTSDITISAGTLVGTTTGSSTAQVQFRITQTVVLYVVLASSYLNADTGLYEIQAPIECTTPGIIGVVGSQTINVLVSAVTGLSGCYNATATSGGADLEDKEIYRQRLSIAWQGNTLCTDNGILSIALAQTGVEDAILVAHGNSPRQEFGAIDVYIKGVTPAQYVDSFLIDVNSPQQYFVTTKQPLLTTGLQTIIYSDSGSVAPPSASILRDTSAYAGSIKASDRVYWSSPLPAASGTVYTTYTYNGLVETLQGYFTNTNADIANANILVKWATAIGIDVTVTIKVLNGYDSLNVTFDIQDALALFFDGVSIGTQIQQADVAKVILNVAGVDDAKLPFDVFQSSDGSIIPDSFGDLTIPASSYAVSGDIIINVVA